MPRRQRSVGYIIVAALLTSLLAGVGPAAAQAPAPLPEPSAWTEIDHPRPGAEGTNLNDVVVPAANDMWAVGNSYTFDDERFEFRFRTYGQHCVDSVCSQADLPNRGDASASNALNAVGAVSPSDIWTVGYSRDLDAASRALAIRYDGSSWQIVDTPNPAGSFGNILNSVAHLRPDYSIAVGSYQASGSVLEVRPLAMRWNGTSWTLLRVPAVPGCGSRASLSDAAPVGTSVFMVGTCQDTAGVDAGFVLSRSAAGAWTVQVSPEDGLLPTPSTLRSITFVPGGGVIAVGTSHFALQEAAGVSIRFAGGTWAPVRVPPVGRQSTHLAAVAGIAPNEIFAVGSTIDRTFLQRLTLYWDGRRYVDVPAGGDRAANSDLDGVAYDPAGFWWSVGTDTGDSIVLRIPSR